MKNTMTAEQALQRAEQYVREAISVLPAEAKLEVLSTPTTQACDDPTDNGPRGRVFASNRYWIRGLDPSKTNEYLQAVLRWWSEHGFAGSADSWEKAQFVTVENAENGFRMAFQDGGDGALSIGASSPCVWPKGTPAPSD